MVHGSWFTVKIEVIATGNGLMDFRAQRTRLAKGKWLTVLKILLLPYYLNPLKIKSYTTCMCPCGVRVPHRGTNR